MALSVQPSPTMNAEFIPAPVGFESIIELLMRFHLIDSANPAGNAIVTANELPAGSHEEIFTWDYDSLLFDDLRLK